MSDLGDIKKVNVSPAAHWHDHNIRGILNEDKIWLDFKAINPEINIEKLYKEMISYKISIVFIDYLRKNRCKFPEYLKGYISWCCDYMPRKEIKDDFKIHLSSLSLI